jgi:PAS domain S-box-containing protein
MSHPESKFRILFETTHAAIFILEDGRCVDCNPAAVRIFGRTREELLQHRPSEFSPPLQPDGRTSAEESADRMRRALAGSPQHFDWVHLRADGSAFAAEISLTGFEWERRLLLQAIVRDVSDRRRTEQALGESEAKYKALIETTGTGYVILDADGRVLDANQEYVRLAGSTALAQIIGRRVSEWTAEEDQERNLAAVRQCLEHGAVRNLEIHYLSAAGKVTPVEVNATVCRTGPSVQILSLCRDISQRRQAEATQKMSGERLEKTNRCLVTLGPDHHANINRLTALCGELLGATCALYNRLENGCLRSVGQWQTPPDYKTTDRAEGHICYDVIRNNQDDTTVVADLAHSSYASTDPNVRAYGLQTYLGCVVRCEGKPVGSLCVVFTTNHQPAEDDRRILGIIASAIGSEDTRRMAEEERQKFESKVQQAQKLESLGVLAGGIAHDFNNLLTAILGNANLALMDLAPESPSRESLRAIEEASCRAAELCRQMLAYAGRNRFVAEPVNLSRLVRELTHLLHVSLSKKALFRSVLAEDLPAIEGDPAQLRQVVMNLIINASEAIGEVEGVIAIFTGAMQCDDAYLRECHPADSLAGGQYVYFEVIDTGCGMNPPTLARIFDPFFTTKFSGRGLGLASVLGIVRQHKGAIKVESSPGHGTTFRVLFPASARAAVPTESDGPGEDWQGTGTILLVDDEAPVRTVAARMLERCGYQVLLAADGYEAVEQFRAHSTEIACVLLDLAMPRMDGEEAFRELRALRSDVRIVLASGYSAIDVQKRFAGGGLAGFIEKPYQLQKLGALLREVLAAPPTG